MTVGHLESLPNEIHQMILKGLDSPADLHSAILASPLLLRNFVQRKSDILCSIYEEHLSLENLSIAYAIGIARLQTFPREQTQAKLGTQLAVSVGGNDALKSWIELYTTTQGLLQQADKMGSSASKTGVNCSKDAYRAHGKLLRKNLDLLRTVCRISKTVDYFVDAFFQQWLSAAGIFETVGEEQSTFATGPDPDLVRQVGVLPLSRHERQRIQRSFLILELFTTIFNSSSRKSGSFGREIDEAFLVLLKTLPPWRKEEFISVVNYLLELVNAQVNRLSRVMKVDGASYQEDVSAYHVVLYLSNAQEHLFESGLSNLARFLQSPVETQLVMISKPQIMRQFPCLHRLLDLSGCGHVSSCGEAPLRLPEDDALDAPSIGWFWRMSVEAANSCNGREFHYWDDTVLGEPVVLSERRCVYFGRLRSYGYIFWDKRRWLRRDALQVNV